MTPLLGRHLRFIRRFADASRGGIIPIAAAAIPVVAILAIAATELASLSSDRSQMQDVADAVALDAANELTVATNIGVVERARASALVKLAALAARSELDAQAELLNKDTTVRVVLTSRRTSFFGNMLPPGGFVTSAEATATRMRSAPLCVLAHASSPKTVHLGGSSRLSAPECLVHSNNEIGVDGGAMLNATLVQAVGAASGNIDPEAETGAEQVADPFTSLPIAFPTTRCRAAPKFDLSRTTLTLEPGRYCGPVQVGAGQTLNLKAGTYYFTGPRTRPSGDDEDEDDSKGKGDPAAGAGTPPAPGAAPPMPGGLIVSGDAAIRGAGATLLFDQVSTLRIQDNARVNLAGATTGVWAGFLIVAARDNVNDFSIKADGVENLLGTVYLPAAKLLIDGGAPVGAGSEWTIVVAKELEILGSATLVINSRFARSIVPLPAKYQERFGRDRRNARLSR